MVVKILVSDFRIPVSGFWLLVLPGRNGFFVLEGPGRFPAIFPLPYKRRHDSSLFKSSGILVFRRSNVVAVYVITHLDVFETRCKVSRIMMYIYLET